MGISSFVRRVFSDELTQQKGVCKSPSMHGSFFAGCIDAAPIVDPGSPVGRGRAVDVGQSFLW